MKLDSTEFLDLIYTIMTSDIELSLVHDREKRLVLRNNPLVESGEVLVGTYDKNAKMAWVSADIATLGYETEHLL